MSTQSDLIKSIYQNTGKKYYFLGATPEERSSLIAEIVRLIESRIKIPVPKDGKTPTREELVRLIKPLIPVVKDGHTPTTAELLNLIEPLIPIPEKGDDGHTPTEKELKALVEPMVKTIASELSQKLEKMFSTIPVPQPIKPTVDELTSIIEPMVSRILADNRNNWFAGGAGGDLTDAGFGLTVTRNAIGRKIFALDTGVIPSGFQAYGEEVSGSGTAWTLANAPTAGTLRLFANGQRLKEGASADYTLSGANITTTLSWDAGSLLADYSYT